MFSFKKSRFFWLRSNVILILLTALLLLNKPYWEKNANVMFFMFVCTAELFIILLALVYGFQTKKTIARPPSRAIRKTNIPIGIFVFSIFSLFFGFAMSGDIPYPNSALIIYLTINMVFAFVSLFVPTLIIKLYEVNVYDESNGLITDFFSICSHSGFLFKLRSPNRFSPPPFCITASTGRHFHRCFAVGAYYDRINF